MSKMRSSKQLNLCQNQLNILYCIQNTELTGVKDFQIVFHMEEVRDIEFIQICRILGNKVTKWDVIWQLQICWQAMHRRIIYTILL